MKFLERSLSDRAVLGRITLPTLIFVIYAFKADLEMTLLSLPLYFSIMYFSIIEKGKYITENDIINGIMFIFFVMSPMQAISNGKFIAESYASSININYGYIIIAQLMIFIFYTSYMFFSNKFKQRVDRYEFVVNDKVAIILLMLLCVAFVLHIISYGGWGNMMSSRYLRDDEDVHVTMLGWKAILIATSAILFGSAFGAQRSTPFQKSAAIFALILLALSVNPFNIARNVFVAAWLPIFYITLRGRITPIVIHIIFAISIVVIMPIMNSTSRLGASLSESFAQFRENAGYSINTPLSDVFYTTVTCVWWFRDSGYYYGSKTISLILFLVPRSFWSGKATLTGLDIGEYFHEMRYTGTDNLSFFIAGDFYADLGLIGVFLGSILTAYIVYLAVFRKTFVVNGWHIKTLLFMGAVPILIRGPVGANVGLFFFQMIFFAILIRTLPALSGVPPLKALDKKAVRHTRVRRSRI